MKSIVIFLAFAFALAASSAEARTVKRPVCADTNVQFSWRDFLLGTGPAPRANGCAPAIYQGNRLVGQDPDPNVRLQLNRDSANEGYELNVR